MTHRPSRTPRRRTARLFAGFLTAAALVIVPAIPASADAVRDAQYWLDLYGVRSAWSVTEGEGVIVAVIDTGVDSSVPELEGAVMGGADFSGQGASDGQQPVGATGSEHGTLVASLLAGRGRGPGTGVIGVAPKAQILSISVGFDSASADADQQIADAVRFAVDQGADVINMSLTRNTLTWPTSWDEAFLYAAQHEVVVVAAAGNRSAGTTVVGAPATMPGVLTVAGVNRAGTASEGASSQGITIGVSAPSEQLLGVMPGGAIVRWDGTSGAAPLVSGVAALVRSAYPQLDAANVINRIVATSTEVGIDGPDAIYGFGLIDAYAAVTADVPAVEANPLGDLAEWIHLHRRAETEPESVPPPVLPSIDSEVVTDAAAESPVGRLIPSIELLRTIGMPTLVVLGFVAAVAGLSVWTVRRFEVRRERH